MIIMSNTIGHHHKKKVNFKHLTRIQTTELLVTMLTAYGPEGPKRHTVPLEVLGAR